MTEPRLPRPGPGMPPARPGAALPPAYRADPGLPPPAYRPGPGMPPARPRQDVAGAAPRQLRPIPVAAPRPTPMRPAGDTRPARVKADPNPLRMLIGLAGLASASAITSALLPSILPATAAASTGNGAAIVAPQPSVIHVTRTVQLAPGQTAPPNAPVQVQPQPTPQVRIQVITRQSGRP